MRLDELAVVILQGNYQDAKALIASGADINSVPILGFLLKNRQNDQRWEKFEFIRFVLRNGFQVKPEDLHGLDKNAKNIENNLHILFYIYNVKYLSEQLDKFIVKSGHKISSVILDTALQELKIASANTAKNNLKRFIISFLKGRKDINLFIYGHNTFKTLFEFACELAADSSVIVQAFLQYLNKNKDNLYNIIHPFEQNDNNNNNDGKQSIQQAFKGAIASVCQAGTLSLLKNLIITAKNLDLFATEEALTDEAGYTPFKNAVENKNLEISQYIIERIDPTKVAKLWNLAVQIGFVDLLPVMLDKIKSLPHSSKEIRKRVQYARKKGSDEVLEVLSQYFGKEIKRPEGKNLNIDLTLSESESEAPQSPRCDLDIPDNKKVVAPKDSEKDDAASSLEPDLDSLADLPSGHTKKSTPKKRGIANPSTHKRPSKKRREMEDEITIFRPANIRTGSRKKELDQDTKFPAKKNAKKSQSNPKHKNSNDEESNHSAKEKSKKKNKSSDSSKSRDVYMSNQKTRKKPARQPEEPNSDNDFIVTDESSNDSHYESEIDSYGLDYKTNSDTDSASADSDIDDAPPTEFYLKLQEEDDVKDMSDEESIIDKTRYIAHFRCHHFFRKADQNLYRFTREDRQAIRSNINNNESLYSNAVLNQNESNREFILEEVIDNVLELKKSGVITDGNRIFNSKYEYHQQLYSNSYKKYHDTLKNAPHTFNFNFELNPHISTTDLVEDAFRYGFAQKVSGKRWEERLRPRFRVNGRAKYPYVGILYVILHSVEDYELLIKNHVISMFANDELDIHTRIVNERETSFVGGIDRDAVVLKMILKVPSFVKYTNEFPIKYGINTAEFNDFKAQLKSYPRGTKRHKEVKNRIIRHIIQHKKKWVMEQLQEIMQNRHGQLVYQNVWGGYSETPPSLQFVKFHKYLVRYKPILSKIDTLGKLLKVLNGELKLYKINKDEKPILMKLLGKINDEILSEFANCPYDYINQFIGIYLHGREAINKLLSDYSLAENEHAIQLITANYSLIYEFLARKPSEYKEHFADIKSNRQKYSVFLQILTAFKKIKKSDDPNINNLVMIFNRHKNAIANLKIENSNERKINDNNFPNLSENIDDFEPPFFAEINKINSILETVEENLDEDIILEFSDDESDLELELEPIESEPELEFELEPLAVVQDETVTTELILATLTGDIDKVQEVIDQKKISLNSKDEFTKYVNKKDENGYAAFHYAARDGHIEIINLFLIPAAHMARTIESNDGETPLHLATLHGQAEVVNRLLKHSRDLVTKKTKSGYSILHLACIGGYFELVKILLTAGVNVLAKTNQDETAFDIAKKAGFEEIAALLEDAMLLFSTIKNSITSSRKNSEVDWKKVKETCRKIIKKSELMQTLFAYYCVSIADHDKRLFTYCIARDGNLKMVKFLLSNGVDFSSRIESSKNTRSNLYTPFIVACNNGHIKVAKELLKKGNVNIDEKNYDESTALHVTSKKGRLKTVRFLLRYGANTELLFKGKDARQLAEENNQFDTASLFMLSNNNASSNESNESGEDVSEVSGVSASNSSNSEPEPTSVSETKSESSDNHNNNFHSKAHKYASKVVKFGGFFQRKNSSSSSEEQPIVSTKPDTQEAKKKKIVI